MTDYFSYGPCSVCGEQLLDYDEIHTDTNGEDCHEECCPRCNAVCCVCGNKASPWKVEVVVSDVDPLYASVCDECVSKHNSQCILEHYLAFWYKTDWPNYCKKCNGEGYIFFPGNYYDPPEYNPCDCILGCLCPRCGFEHDNEWNGESCVECGWLIGGTDSFGNDSFFYDPECFCDEDQ